MPRICTLLLATLSLSTTILGSIHPRGPPTANSTAALPLSSLATSYPLALTPQNPTIVTQIHNTLSHYPLAIDGKNFAALNRVFTADVVANFSAPLGVLNGLPAVISTLNATLFPVNSQHALSTTVIELAEDAETAKSVTYFTASQFGMGEYYGQVYYSYGQYQDDWVKTASSGEWRIKFRTLVYMGPSIGNQSVFT